METLEFARSIATLFFVLLLIVGLAFGFKRWLPKLQASGRLPVRRMRLVETIVLDPRNRLALVSLDGRELLLGLGQSGPVPIDMSKTAAVSEAKPAIHEST